MKAIGRVYYWMGIGLFLLSFFFVYNFIRIISKLGPAVKL
jgi:hypothetical protein